MRVYLEYQNTMPELQKYGSNSTNYLSRWSPIDDNV